ncbi:MAG TPA: polysaccharide biosynthesis tyrosine autokinase [Acidimicrobiales bacterium]|nr:polysaccharide biosynthesis tyrosine autokinase [Acidimicrobiales bacterium]
MDDRQGERQLYMRDYAQILNRRKWSIILILIIAVGLGVGYDSVSTKKYTATAQLQLTPQVSQIVQQAQNPVSITPIVDVPTAIQVIQSTSVQDAVRKTVPNAPSVSVKQVQLTNVVTVSVTATTAKLAAAAANAYANAYLSVQQQQAVSTLNNAEQIIQSDISGLDQQIAGVQNQISSGGPTAPLAQQQSLATQLTSLQSQRTTYVNQLNSYQFAAQLNTAGGQVIGIAPLPVKPSSPKPVTDIALAVVIGLIIGIGVALLREYYDESIRTMADLERVTRGVPTLGLVPAIGDWRSDGEPYLVSEKAPTSPPSEAYRSLRTSIQFLGLERDIKTLLFTSPGAAEGKTTTMANMATTMAHAGQSVVMICCDLRRPRIHQFFGLSNQVGFTSVLLGTATLDEALQRAPGIPGLYLLASGPTPPNPSELLSDPRARAVFAQLAERADIVLIDSPPVLPVTDAAVLATTVDGVIMVTSVGNSSRKDVARAIEVLGRVNAPLVGIVLNKASESDSYAYYRYSYGPTDNDQWTKARGASIPNGKASLTAPTKVAGGDSSEQGTP